MTREQAKTILVSCGVAEPTDEQITNYLNSVNSEVKKEKDRADRYKTDADKAAELQKQLEEIANRDLSDVEKANKATEEALKQNEELQKRLDRMEQMNKLAEKGIIGEQAEKLISSDGKLDYEILGQIISDRENAAKVAKEQEIANSQGNPGGGAGGGNDDDTTPEDVKNAESISFGAAPKDAKAVFDYYS